MIDSISFLRINDTAVYGVDDQKRIQTVEPERLPILKPDLQAFRLNRLRIGQGPGEKPCGNEKAGIKAVLLPNAIQAELHGIDTQRAVSILVADKLAGS